MIFLEDVYVIGLPDKRMGEELCACIRLKKDAQMTEDELKLYCKDKVKFATFCLIYS